MELERLIWELDLDLGLTTYLHKRDLRRCASLGPNIHDLGGCSAKKLGRQI